LEKIEITKGHDIRISGIPNSESYTHIMPKKISISPKSFRNVKPKLLVAEGEVVKIGSPLFYDKTKTKVRFASPAAGKIANIKFGPRRVIENIEIEIDGSEALKNDSLQGKELSSIKRDEALQFILKSNLFHFFRERPFNQIPNPDKIPRDIFISGYNTAPLSVDLVRLIGDNHKVFQKGLSLVSKLTDGKTFFSSKEKFNFKDVENILINGPHPAGNIGIQVHHIKPLKPNEFIWTINAQHVLTLGKLFEKGIYDPEIIVSIGGSGAIAPYTAKTISGVPILSLIENQNLNKKNIRIVSGDVLTGKNVSEEGYIDFYDSTLSLINDNVDRPFLGMLSIGTSSTKYSLTRVFFNMKEVLFNFTTAQNGELRPIVPLNTWEKVLPMDIFPNELYRAILAKDIDEMEKLGIWECDDEDFALCSFSCPSKIDVGEVIRDGLDLIYLEG